MVKGYCVAHSLSCYFSSVTLGQASTHISASVLKVSIKWKILSFSRVVVINHTGLKYHQAPVHPGTRSIVHP